MSLPPREQSYACPKCNHKFTRSVDAFAIPPRTTPCQQCRCEFATISFDNVFQKQAAQKTRVRSAGDSLISASDSLSKAIRKSNKVIGSRIEVDQFELEQATAKLKEAGENLANLP
ncbi:hypothetical protein [Vibrio cionasavignyae]|uniref:hypothetical protein n=1 Tax=Vibrio cionasavignyae TaxID=2910252 RepID=UPI003D14ED80